MAFDATRPAWTNTPKTDVAAILANFTALWPYTTAGDLSYAAGATANKTRLAIGTTGQVLTVVGGVPAWAAKRSVLLKTGDYTIAVTDDTVIYNKATAIVAQLPAATGSGIQLTIKNVGAGACTITRAGSDTIDGETTQVLQQYEGCTVIDYASGLWAVI